MKLDQGRELFWTPVADCVHGSLWFKTDAWIRINVYPHTVKRVVWYRPPPPLSSLNSAKVVSLDGLSFDCFGSEISVNKIKTFLFLFFVFAVYSGKDKEDEEDKSLLRRTERRRERRHGVYWGEHKTCILLRQKKKQQKKKIKTWSLLRRTKRRRRSRHVVNWGERKRKEY